VARLVERLDDIAAHADLAAVARLKIEFFAAVRDAFGSEEPNAAGGWRI